MKLANKELYATFVVRRVGRRTPPRLRPARGAANPCKPKRPLDLPSLCLRVPQNRSSAPSVANPCPPEASSAAFVEHRWPHRLPLLRRQQFPSLRSGKWRPPKQFRRSLPARLLHRFPSPQRLRRHLSRRCGRLFQSRPLRCPSRKHPPLLLRQLRLRLRRPSEAQALRSSRACTCPRSKPVSLS